MEGWANKTKIVVVCGPTATGKTDLAFALCRKFGGELVGADSMQIYKGLPIGTAAPSAADFADIPRHLVACLSPRQAFSVADYVELAGMVIQKIAEKGKLPVVCGGTGLYIDSLVKGISFTDENADATEIAKLEEELKNQGGAALLERLAVLDPETAARLHPANGKRIVRALALSEATGTTLAQRNAARCANDSVYDALALGLCYDDRQMLYRRIEARVEAMLASGLLYEAEEVFKNREVYKTAAQAIGYKEFFPLFLGEKSLEDCVSALKQATRRYAKRQLTWFGHRPYLRWLAVDTADVLREAELAVQAFLPGCACGVQG